MSSPRSTSTTCAAISELPGSCPSAKAARFFGSGSRNTVAITLLVKTPGKAGSTEIRYRDIGDYLTREQKLAIIADSAVAEMDWTPITPNEAGDWINQRNAAFANYPPIGDKDSAGAIFRTYSGGLKTNRDAWVYNSSCATVKRTARATVDFYNSEVDRYIESLARTRGTLNVDDFINTDPTRISWNRADKNNIARGANAPRYQYDEDAIRLGSYRPFNKQHVYFDRRLNDMIYQLPSVFPAPEVRNPGFVIISPRPGTDFGILAVDVMPDLSYFTYATQFFPRYRFSEPDLDALSFDGVALDRIDNISDRAHADYQRAYGPEVTKDDIFYFVYGLLHSPEYREQFGADLKKMLPRIPQVADTEDFRAFAAAGRELAALHIGYESVEPYKLTITGEPSTTVMGDRLYDHYRVEKMKFDGKAKEKDRSIVIYNPRITVSGIPDVAHQYMLGSRSGIEWVMERYQVKTDKASDIVNDPNDWSREVGDPRYILDLLARVVTVSVETVRIVESLPSLSIK